MLRVKILSTALVAWLMLGLISCESIEEDPIIDPQDFYGDGSYYVELARLKAPVIREESCNSIQVLELRNEQDLSEYGTASIYHDGESLIIQYDLLESKVFENWKIAASLVWIGPQNEWEFGKDGPDSGWSSISGINLIRYENRPIYAIHRIPLNDWMFNNCFVIAVRLSLEDETGTWTAPKGFINNSSFITYSWNELFCLEKCIDPGTEKVNYWENNPDVWSRGVTVGSIFYSKELAVQIMNGITTNDDISNLLFEELVSAKLNVDLGNTSYCIVEAIEEADAWMEENGPVGSGVLSNHPAWATGNSLANQLESYNNGLMCADPAN